VVAGVFDVAAEVDQSRYFEALSVNGCLAP